MHRQTLIVYCGLPGVGKSAASAYTADRLPANRFRSDEIRKELFPDPTYSSNETDATYAELLDRARTDLDSSRNVVLDATFQSRRYRDRAAEVATAVEVGVDIEFVRVTCDLEVIKERLAERTDTISDAQFEQHRQLRETFDPLERDHVVIDNSGTLEETYRQIDEFVL